MIDHRFAAITRILIDRPSRREVLHALTGGGLAAMVHGPLGSSHADARKKRGKTRKKYKRRKKRRPAGRDPVTTADAACDTPYWAALFSELRFAQTFRALRSGRLTRASISLTHCGEGAAFDLAIRELDPEGKPGYVLAHTAISNVPGTNLGEPPTSSLPPRTISGDFAAPATVVAGQMYALTLTLTHAGTGWDPTWGPFGVLADTPDPCPDGMLFIDKRADGAFVPQPPWDLAFSTEVTA